MFDMIKKIFGMLSALPAFASVFRRASQSGKIDPAETLEALSSVSPGTKKISDTAMKVTQQGGGIPQVAQALTNIGEIEVLGQKVNTRTMVSDLKKAGGLCSALGNMLDKLRDDTPENIVNLGNAASDTSNWNDILKSN